ncbi:MAG: pectate lyase family protein [Acidimicrobiales bacterium]
MKSPSSTVPPSAPDSDATAPSRRKRLWWAGAIVVIVVAATVVALLVGRDTTGSPSQPPSASPSPPLSGTQTPGAASLLAGRVGFGRNTVGGDGGPVVHVTTAADDGAGSLRAAVAGTDPRWIVFDGDYTIQSSHGILVGSNKTIDGRGRRVTLTAPNQDGLVLNGSHNVIIENLIAHDFGDTTKTKSNNPFDAIRLDKASTDIWIDHSDLSRAGDKLIAVDGGTTNVTVSWNRFHDQEQVIQIGNQTNSGPDTNQTLTIHHNFFDATGYRNPVISHGRAHVFNNYLADWQTYGMRSERSAQLYSEDNIFEAGANRKATQVKPGGNGCNDKKTLCDSTPGALKSVGDLALNGADIETNQPDSVFDPHQDYPYKADTADETLKQAVAAQAGWLPS